MTDNSLKCLIVDLETTGLVPEVDRIIEIGLLEFVYLKGSSPTIASTYGALEDPGCEISETVTRVTGLTTEALKGQSINWSLVRDYFLRADVVIAHNASFEKSFLRGCQGMKEIDIDSLAWGCSLRHIDWDSHGFKSKSLNYLAADHGFVNPFAHRALFDCATTFRVITPYITELLDRVGEKTFVIEAVGAPFESKDALKMRGYYWDRDARVWRKTVRESFLNAEREFLATSVYFGASRHSEKEAS